MRRGKFSANFENAEFLAVSVVSIVSLIPTMDQWTFRTNSCEKQNDAKIANNFFQIFLIVAVMGGFVVTECGRRKSKFLDIEMVFLIGPRV